MSGEIMGQQQQAVLVILLQVMMIMFSVNLICCDTEFLIREGSYDSSPFPSNFLFGTASSAYQYEGAYLSDGKGLNNWDVFTHQQPGDIKDGSNGDVAVDQYHRYLEDMQLMASLGVNSYRFSISWTRILPKGRFGGINFAGIKHYNRLIDALLRHGIEPFVTLNHVDLPQELEDRYGSWLSSQMQVDFGYLADICFEYFGDRVKYWVTINEPNLQMILSYQAGIFPPCRCSSPFGNCSRGNSKTEPFIAAHNMILAHARAVDIYRTKYQKKQGGKIGIVVETVWFEPISDSIVDKLAAERARSFYSNWILDPVIFGRYPIEMKNILGPVLPRFSSEEAKKLGLDFIGINHYRSYFVKDCLFSPCDSEPGKGTSRTEGFVQKLTKKGNVSIGEPTDITWQHIHPEGFRKTIEYLKCRFNNIPIFITENGFGDLKKPNSTTYELLHDAKRVQYMSSYLDALQTTMREGADVRGYFAWSLLDNYEWLDGYTSRFGLHHVDFKSLKRTPKLSAIWYKSFIANHSMKIL